MAFISPMERRLYADMMRRKGLLFLILAGAVLTACHEQKPAKVGTHDKEDVEAIKQAAPSPKAEPVTPPGQDKNDILVVSDQLPSYDGGYDKMLADIRQRIRYPESAKSMHFEGRVIVAVDLDEQGRLNRPRVLQSTDKLFDDEALRVVGTIQKLHPAMKNGKPVAVEYHIPVIFRLN